MIEGVEVRELEMNSDERGHLVETYRDDWDIFDETPVMSYYSMSYPGIIRAWHRHVEGQIDYYTCPIGRAKVVLYDGREGSPTEGELNEFVIGERDPQVIRNPGDVWHGFKTVGRTPAVLMNYPTSLYDYEDPDEENLPYDTDEIPYDWELEPHERHE